MPKDNRMIGRSGEKHFDLLCSNANVTCHQAVEDDHGWDRLIEFPPRCGILAPIDLQPGITVAAVQIKATRGNKRSVAIRLSNALNQARSMIPQFVLLVAIDQDEKPRFFIKHVWISLIAAWLKAGREADARGVTATNQEAVNLSFEAEDEQNSADLLSWIEREIDLVARPYAATKQSIVDTIGFEQGHGVGRITFALDDPNDILDVQLGLKTQLTAKRFTYTSTRFGIRACKPDIDQQDITIHLMPEGTCCLLRMGLAGGESFAFPAKLYGAKHGTSTAYRVESRVLDIVFGPDTRVQAKAILKTEDRVRLDEMRALSSLISSSQDTEVDLEIDIDGKIFNLGTIRMTGTHRKMSWPWASGALDALDAISAHAKREPADLTMAEINAAADDLKILCALASERNIRTDFTPNGKAEPLFDGFLAYGYTRVGDQVYSAVTYRPMIQDCLVRTRRQLTFGAPKLLWSQTAPAQNWSPDALQTAYQKQLDRLPEETQAMAIGDLTKFVNDGLGDRELKTDLPTGREVPLLRSPRIIMNSRKTAA